MRAVDERSRVELRRLPADARKAATEKAGASDAAQTLHRPMTARARSGAEAALLRILSRRFPGSRVVLRPLEGAQSLGRPSPTRSVLVQLTGPDEAGALLDRQAAPTADVDSVKRAG